MSNPAQAVNAPLWNFGRQTLFLLLSLTLAAVVCLKIEFIPYLLALCCLVMLIALSQLRVANLVLSFILADHLCQLFKRMIFALGPQPMMTYYAFQLLPTLILFMAVITSLFMLSKHRLPPSTMMLILYLLIAGLTTLISPSGTTISGRLAGINQQLVPMLAIFVGMATPVSAYRKIAKLFLILIVASVVYGLYQFATGPTVIDQAWATATHEYSIEGGKVFDYMVGTTPEFRAYSYYADHISWGFFLVLALLFLLAGRSLGAVSQTWLYLAVPIAIAGVLSSETRTVWVALLGALLVHRVLTLRSLRRPILMLTGVVVSFGLVLSAGGYMMQHYSFGLTSSSLVNRYLTVGTMEARISAWTLFLSVLPSHWLLGTGYGYGSGFHSLDPNYQFAPEMYSHNLIVDLVLQTGLAGTITMVLFVYMWLNEAFWVVNESDAGMGRAVRWMIAAVVGMLLTGSLNGGTFLTSYFCIFLGFVSGQWMRLRVARTGSPFLISE